MSPALLLLLGVAVGADPDQLRARCVEGEADACAALMPPRSERWALLDDACNHGIAKSCLELAQAVSDDPAARAPDNATAWFAAACAAGSQDSCARARAAEPLAVLLSPEGIAVDGNVQVRFSGQGAWALPAGSREGRTIKPVYGMLRSLARERGLDQPGSQAGTLEVRIHPEAPSAVVGDLLHSAALAGWRQYRLGTLRAEDADLIPVWLPARGNAETLDPVMRAAAESRPDGVLLLGEVDPDHVRTVLRRNQPAINTCWDAAVRESPDQGGRIEIRFVIGATGHVDDATVWASELGNSTLEGCIVRAVEGLVFDPPSSGGVTTIDYPMVLEPVYATPQ